MGKEVNRKLELLTSIISASAITEGSEFIVIEGPPQSGKTVFLKKLKEKLSREENIQSCGYREMNRIQSLPIFNNIKVVTLDDADVENLNQSIETQLIKYYRSRNQVVIITCRDSSKLKTIINTCNGSVHTMPEPNDKELKRIISRNPIMGYRVSDKSAEKIVNLLTAYGTGNKLSKSISIVRLLLYPRLHKSYRNNEDTNNVTLTFDDKEIYNSISTLLNVSVFQDDKDSEDIIRERLESRIKGQDHIIDEILPLMLTIGSGLTDPTKPAGVLFFYGPTGTGKTELGKCIADVLFDGVFHKEDMNTYSEKHSVSKLTGAPPGYLGYGDTPAILDFMDNNSRGVILLDEVEKSHDVVMDHIMELMDTGFFKDSRGKIHDARGFLIILTSNVTIYNTRNTVISGFGAEPEDKELTPGEEILKSGKFRPEFMSRITSVLKFKTLPYGVIHDIADMMFNDLSARLKSIGLKVAKKKQYIKEIADEYDAERGARSMKNFAETEIKNRILESNRKKDSKEGKC